MDSHFPNKLPLAQPAAIYMNTDELIEKTTGAMDKILEKIDSELSIAIYPSSYEPSKRKLFSFIDHPLLDVTDGALLSKEDESAVNKIRDGLLEIGIDLSNEAQMAAHEITDKVFEILFKAPANHSFINETIVTIALDTGTMVMDRLSTLYTTMDDMSREEASQAVLDLFIDLKQSFGWDTSDSTAHKAQEEDYEEEL